MKNIERRMGERKQLPGKMLRTKLENLSRDKNKEIKEKYGLDGLLKSDGSLDPDGYSEIYGEEEIKTDEDLVRELEIEFSSADNPNVQAFYLDEFGAKTEDEIIAKWRDNKSKEKSGQMEMAITTLLTEKLGENFLVIRTAPYDDYKNAVDNLILDKVTGEVVGAFDEVHEVGDGSRANDKEAKIARMAKEGGARIRYGLKLEDGKLVRASLEGVPVFYLGLLSSELTELLYALENFDKAIKEKVFMKLLASLSDQHALLQKDAAPSLLSALDSFGRSLARLSGREVIK